MVVEKFFNRLIKKILRDYTQHTSINYTVLKKSNL
ncbi:hypothetical protein SAMN03097699_1562 [Flavobacteriaceae bacterium MAR_2010_188]|nr:hypothetical protein SAMN03097699_1562 [Flavobacteriaceae bacterium MAR_2010_188]